MSIVRNTVVLRNAALGSLVVLALFECNGFVAVRFGIKGVFCKDNHINTLRTSRVHGPRPCTRHVHGRLHGSYAAVYTARSRPCTQPTHTCTPPLQSRVRAIYTAVYTASTQPYTRAMYTARTRLCKCSCTRVVYTGRVHGPSCTWQEGLPGHVHVPRRHATDVCGPSRPCTRPVHSSFTAMYTAVCDGRPTRAYVYTAAKKAVYAPCTLPCTRPVHSRVHGR